MLDGGIGEDEMEGGRGNDSYHVDNSFDVIYELPDAGMDEVYASVDLRLPQAVENLILTGSIALSGGGNDLDNELEGNDLPNHLAGDGGSDSLTGAAGNDTLNGGTGTDQAVYTDPQANYTVTSSRGGFTITDNTGADGTDTLSNIESLVFADTTQPLGKPVDLVVYTWKAHTLLSDVHVTNLALSLITQAQDATYFAVNDASLSLTASRTIPTTEAAATASAVNLQDAIAILKMIVDLDVNGAGHTLSPYQTLAADFDGNGAVGLTDAIGVLKHVVGLTAPQPDWHFVYEADASVPGITPADQTTPPAIDIALPATSAVQVGLVGYLSGDVDGSYTGAATAQTLDSLYPGYLTNLTIAHSLSLSQFGVYQ